MALMLAFLFGVAIGLAIMYGLWDLWWAEQELHAFNRPRGR